MKPSNPPSREGAGGLVGGEGRAVSRYGNTFGEGEIGERSGEGNCFWPRGG